MTKYKLMVAKEEDGVFNVPAMSVTSKNNAYDTIIVGYKEWKELRVGNAKLKRPDITIIHREVLYLEVVE